MFLDLIDYTGSRIAQAGPVYILYKKGDRKYNNYLLMDKDTKKINKVRQIFDRKHQLYWKCEFSAHKKKTHAHNNDCNNNKK